MEQEVRVKLTEYGVKTLQNYLQRLTQFHSYSLLSRGISNYIFSGLSKDGYYTGTLSQILVLFGSDLDLNLEGFLPEEELSCVR